MDERQWAAWHAEYDRRRARPHGFLSVTGLHWLDGTPRRFPGVPGSWRSGPDGVTVALDDGEDLRVDGVAVTGVHRFGVVDEEGVTAACGDILVEIARRGEGIMLRPRDPSNPLLVGYAGTPAYPPQEKWIVAGRYRPFDEPREITVGTVIDGLRGVDVALGRVEFEAGGVPLSLTVFAGAEPGSLSTSFTDATSGATTYPAGRRLAIGAPDADGGVLLDFNRATNPPCAYSDFATCALPPAENRLPAAIEAGEQIPYERQERSPVM